MSLFPVLSSISLYMCKSETDIFLNSGFMCCMKHVYCCTVQPSKEIQRRSALVSCGRWEMDFAFPSSQNIPEPWDPLQKYDGFACSFIMMSWWACNNRVPVRHNNNTHTQGHTVQLSVYSAFLLPALLLSDAVWFESIPNRPGAKPRALAPLTCSVPLLAEPL